MRTLLVLLAVLIFAPAVARSEKANMSAEQLRKAATHIVTGTVEAIYVREVEEGSWKVKHHVAEVAIDKVEKGDDLKSGGLVYARYWTRRWNSRKPMPPSTTGHRGIPKEGDSLRIYLARNAYHGFGTGKDGGFDVFGANGFEKLK